MMKFKKKPVEVEALPISLLLYEMGLPPDQQDIPGWVRVALTDGTLTASPQHVTIETLEGSMVGEYGDWLIRGVLGEVYPCKPDIFEMTYEAVPQAPTTEVKA
jgi:hypothetical protein